MADVRQERIALTQTLFSGSIPALWCPLLTHYRADESIDPERIRAHIARLRPSVSAFLAPGSTGDGWEMDDAEVDQLLGLLVDEAARHGFRLMVGVLRPTASQMQEVIRACLDRFTGGDPGAAACAAAGIAGFTVTPPRGNALRQDQIYTDLEAVAALGAPLAIYQLPQVTENEMTADTVARLAAEHPNVYLLKDTSGADRVLLSGIDLHGLFMVRGAEGEYAEWIGSGRQDRPYDGLLLSTANCFAAELATIIDLVRDGAFAAARDLSARVTRVVEAVFAAASPLPFGNPFSNANRALDHLFALGADGALRTDPPMTHSGTRLPHGLIALASEALASEGFAAGSGYL